MNVFLQYFGSNKIHEPHLLCIFVTYSSHFTNNTGCCSNINTVNLHKQKNNTQADQVPLCLFWFIFIKQEKKNWHYLKANNPLKMENAFYESNNVWNNTRVIGGV